MKKLLVIALTLSILPGCSSVQYEARPSHVKEVVLEDGTVIQEYVVGYSIEDFYAQWHGTSTGRN